MGSPLPMPCFNCMKEIVFNRKLYRKDQGKYIHIPFNVPDSIERIEVSYRYCKTEYNILDLGIYGKDGTLRGWSGSARTEVYLSYNESTPGYASGAIEAGLWAVALGLYKIENQLDVEITIRFKRKEQVFLSGDIHIHTVNSDGVMSTAEVIRASELAGLDFIAITDHNNAFHEKEIGNTSGITVIRGMEYTNYNGHANFFFPTGTDSFVRNPLSNSFEEMAETFIEAKLHGAVISLNHIRCEFCPWLFGFEDIPFDMVEVWNGPMKASEMEAIAWWQENLSKGKRIPAVGGSDTHRIEMMRSFGTPTTHVLADSRFADDILEALRKGRSSISVSPSGPWLWIRSGNSNPGETFSSSDNTEVEVTVKRAVEGAIVVVWDGKGTKREWEIPSSGDATLSFHAESDAVFYRAELYGEFLGQMILFALTNPLYISNRQSDIFPAAE